MRLVLRIALFVPLVLVLAACGTITSVHHRSLRDLSLGMNTDQVAEVLDGRYIRRGAVYTEGGTPHEFWQVLVGEDYESWKQKDGKWKLNSPYGAAPAKDNSLYWLGFSNGKLDWWGHIGDWGKAGPDEKLRIDLNISGDDEKK